MAAVAIAQKMSPEVSRVSRESRGLIASALKRMLKDASWKKALEDADGRPELAQRLYQVVMEIHEKHAATLSRMCETLQPTETTAYPQFVGVTDELFKDGINWGRIATLLAFGVHLGLYFQDHGMPEMVPSVIGWLQRLAENDLLVWIQKQGGWDGFYNHFGELAKSNSSSPASEEQDSSASWAKLGLWIAATCALALFTAGRA